MKMIKEMKKYKVFLFLLFLIMSMSIFAGDDYVVEESNINLNYYPKITFTGSFSGQNATSLKEKGKVGDKEEDEDYGSTEIWGTETDQTTDQRTITYTSTLGSTVGETVTVTFKATNQEWTASYTVPETTTTTETITTDDGTTITTSENTVTTTDGVTTSTSITSTGATGTTIVMEGVGIGNEIESGVVSSLDYYDMKIEIDLKSASTTDKIIEELIENITNITKITIGATETTYDDIDSYSLIKSSSIDDETIWTLSYSSTSEVEAGDDVVIKFDIANSGNSGQGNNNSVTVTYTVPYYPRNIDEIETYEEANDDWGDGKKTTVKVEDKEYIFTKGGATSYIASPAIYVTIPKYNDDYKDGEEITELKIKKLNAKGEVDTSVDSKSINVSQSKDYEEIVTVTSNFVEGANRIRVTPLNKYEVEGNSEDFYFVLDTQVNDTYLEDEIIGELTSTEELKEEYNLMTDDEKKRYSMDKDDIENLTSDKIIIVNLDELKELSGIVEYSYKFEVGDEEKSGADDDVKGDSSITLSPGSTDKIIVIDPSDFVEGSKATLLFTVYDKLGNEKTFEKTYFIPKDDAKIRAQIEDEVKYRNSKLKIVTEGNEDSFGLKSNVSGSLE